MPEQWPKQDRPARYYTFPLTLHTKLEVSGPFPLTVEEWERFKQLLDAMEPGLRDGYHPEPAKSDAPAPKPAAPKSHSSTSTPPSTQRSTRSEPTAE
jgi:hypothetical protein